MQEGIKNNFESILKELMSSKNVSTITNPKSEINDTHNPQPSGSKVNTSTELHATSNILLDSDEADHPLRASDIAS